MRPGRVVLWVLAVVVVGFAVWFVKAVDDQSGTLFATSGSTPGDPSAPAYGAVTGPASAESSTSAPQPTDLPQFDRAAIGGSDCAMTYGPAANGGTVTSFVLDKPGELITHVSGPGGDLYRHDEQESAGPVSFVYPVPLGQVMDMGASLYLSDGSTQTCSIGPAS